MPHVRSGKLADQAATIQPVLAALCGPASNGIASITSPWASVTCGATGTPAQPTAGKASRAALLSADGAMGLAQLQFDKPEVLLPGRDRHRRSASGTQPCYWSSILRAPYRSTPAWEASPGWISTCQRRTGPSVGAEFGSRVDGETIAPIVLWVAGQLLVASGRGTPPQPRRTLPSHKMTQTNASSRSGAECEGLVGC